MAEYTRKLFTKGWTPSDSPINGRPDGLLVMDNLDLDANGEVRLVYGTKKVFEDDYGSPAHSIYSVYLSSLNALTYYLATEDGKVFRNTDDIANAAGSTVRAAFGQAFNRVFICSGDFRVRDTGTTIKDLGINKPGGPPTLAGGAGLDGFSGSWQYAQIYVFKDGGYTAKSPASSIAAISVEDREIEITPRLPVTDALDNSEVSEIWLFRRGGTLDRFYRIARIAGDYAGTYSDSLSDLDALAVGVVLNQNIIPINSANISDPILEMIGLISGRMVYFTENLVYFSEINSPDSVDPTKAVAHSGDDSEFFLWALQVGENSALIATTKDVYILSGTFITQPDGTIDVAMRPLGIEAKPLSRDAAVYNGSVIYMSTYGWRSIALSGLSQSLVVPNTDRLYRGENTTDYYGVPSVTHDLNRYSICVAEERVWCRVPTFENGADAPYAQRFEIFDLSKQYWHVRKLTPILLHSTELNFIVGTFEEAGEHYLYFIDHYEGKLLNQGDNAENPDIEFKTIFFDCGSPKSRKEALVLTLGINTGGQNIAVSVFKDGDEANEIALGNISSNGWSLKYININESVEEFRNLQLKLSGQVSEFRLTVISLIYNQYPEQLLYYHSTTIDLGEISASKKRIRSWPIVIDTLGENVDVTPIVDGGDLATQVVNTNGKRTAIIQITTDAFGIDYALKVSGATPFELWNILSPRIVEALPMASNFDQVGPLELIRYGLIKQFEIRIIAFGGTDIPYNIYFDDAVEGNGIINVIDGQETVRTILLPKRTVANEDSSVVRITFGPTNFNFHRKYTRIETSKTGVDRDLEWIFLDGQEVG